jgi:hypothetical protein
MGKREEMGMAQLENKTIARMPIREKPEITLLLGDDWHTPIKRIWGRKTVQRNLFRIEGENGEPRWFECDDQLAANILANIELFIMKNHINREKLKKLDVVISRTEGGESIATVCKNKKSPKISRFTRMLTWLKNLKR